MALITQLQQRWQEETGQPLPRPGQRIVIAYRQNPTNPTSLIETRISLTVCCPNKWPTIVVDHCTDFRPSSIKMLVMVNNRWVASTADISWKWSDEKDINRYSFEAEFEIRE